MWTPIPQTFAAEKIVSPVQLPSNRPVGSVGSRELPRGWNVWTARPREYLRFTTGKQDIPVITGADSPRMDWQGGRQTMFCLLTTRMSTLAEGLTPEISEWFLKQHTDGQLSVKVMKVYQ